MPAPDPRTDAFKSPDICRSIGEIDPDEWNALDRGDFIFADYRFLKVLEDSGSLGKRTGWYPLYLVQRSRGLDAALLLYMKTNSYGEYIFDWSWANAAHTAGIDYYPKLTAAIPFTPATGPKFLARPGVDFSPLLARAEALQNELGAHSLHFLFTTELETKTLAASGYVVRDSFQYHWQNRSWKDFSEFLLSLRAKRRSDIKRERAAVAQLPLQIATLSGSDLSPAHADVMYDFYAGTVYKMGGHAYLTRDFFRLLFERMPESILFVLASRDGEPVAGALNLFSGRTLFGRYWGCLEDYRHLHFEVCYYRAIEWGLPRGIELFEAGAQGEHKFNRGFLPMLTRSAHKFKEPGLQRAVADFVRAERAGINELFSDYAAHDPFKRHGDGD